VKTILVPSGTPDGAGAAAAAPGRGAAGDEALFRTLASDADATAPEQDKSLVRDLEGFRAPAAVIAHELEDMSARLGRARQKPGEDTPAARDKK
jgi:hypothetical protein